MTLPPPGWYDDQADPSLLRWWSGRDWTTYTAAKPPTAASTVPTTPATVGERSALDDAAALQSASHFPVEAAATTTGPAVVTADLAPQPVVQVPAVLSEEVDREAQKEAAEAARQAERDARAHAHAAQHEARVEAREARHEAHVQAREARHEHHVEVKAAQDLARRHGAWQAEMTELQGQLDVVERPATDAEGALVLRPGEVAYLIAHGVSLIGLIPGAREWVGGSSGFSIPLGHTGIRYRTGVSRGHVVQAPPHEAAIDVGTFIATNKRASFAGSQQSREWPYGRLISHQIDRQGHMVLSAGRKSEELTFGVGNEDFVAFRMQVALADFGGNLEQLRSSLQSQLNALASAEPEMDRPETGNTSTA